MVYADKPVENQDWRSKVDSIKKKSNDKFDSN